MRVREQDVETQDAYRYFTGVSSGEPQWSADIHAAKTIVAGTVGELSVVWNSYLDRWRMTYTDRGSAARRSARRRLPGADGATRWYSFRPPPYQVGSTRRSCSPGTQKTTEGRSTSHCRSGPLQRLLVPS